MSDSSTAMRPSRGKVWLSFTAGEALGRPLAEWGYRTPRFTNGIKGSDLVEQSREIQRETMIVWFLANHVPATGPYFGFTGPDPNKVVGPYAEGWARFFRGGTASDLMRAEFADIAPDQLIAEVAALFDGLWELVTDEAAVDLIHQTPEQRALTLVTALDDFADAVRKLAPEHGGIGHNGPPDDVPSIAEDEKLTILRATAETRLAVVSSDYSAAGIAWKAISPIVQRLGTGIANQIDNYCTKFTSTLGVATALVSTGYICNILGIWNKAEAIRAMLELANHLLH